MVKVTDTLLPKWLDGVDLAVSMCAEPNGRSTSVLKVEPKCIGINLSATELGKTLELL